jgi:hypothetical protein
MINVDMSGVGGVQLSCLWTLMRFGLHHTFYFILRRQLMCTVLVLQRVLLFVAKKFLMDIGYVSGALTYQYGTQQHCANLLIRMIFGVFLGY